eukprot:7889009-Pyramimonas_sp.AAC.1
METGLSPPALHQDLVVWRRRCYNRKADHLVNYTMDTQRSWHDIFPPERDARDANFVMHFDGGTRKDQCSAAAWLFEAEIDGECVLLARR